jgi:SAM-dependent methyltransferase
MQGLPLLREALRARRRNGRKDFGAIVGEIKNYDVLFEHYRTIAYERANPFRPEHAMRDLDPYFGKLLPKNLDARILDIGCGMGQFLYYLGLKGYRNISGVERSVEQVNFCQENITPNVSLTPDVVSFLAEYPQSLDCVVFLGVIEHIPREQLIPILSAIYQSLAPGGTFILQTANVANPAGMFVRHIDFTHESGFTENSLRQVLRAVGFKDTDIEVTGKQAAVYSWRSHFRNAAQGIWHQTLRLMYSLDRGWDAAPKILSPELIARAARSNSSAV